MLAPHPPRKCGTNRNHERPVGTTDIHFSLCRPVLVAGMPPQYGPHGTWSGELENPSGKTVQSQATPPPAALADPSERSLPYRSCYCNRCCCCWSKRTGAPRLTWPPLLSSPTGMEDGRSDRLAMCAFCCIFLLLLPLVYLCVYESERKRAAVENASALLTLSHARFSQTASQFHFLTANPA